jgi:hypothetical protein
MKKILVLSLMLAMAAPFGGVSVALADSSTDPLCGPDAPEGYKRPGGYCDQLDSKGSLNKGTEEDCNYLPAALVDLKLGLPVLVAVNCRMLETKKVA